LEIENLSSQHNNQHQLKINQKPHKPKNLRLPPAKKEMNLLFTMLINHFNKPGTIRTKVERSFKFAKP
jgi:hypothetical protein